MPPLEFQGKEAVYTHHLGLGYGVLTPDAKKSFSFPLMSKGEKATQDGNLIIHGDNLVALKALMPRYAGKVSCIYIDPPYNTGNENWVYNDRVNSPLMQAWLKENKPIDREDPQRHDKWLCMMWPRLQLLRDLLAEDGVIFVSIDDNEVGHLRLMMDEIFGEKNFIEQIIVITNKGGRDYNQIATPHEYVLVYGKSSGTLINELFQPDKIFKYKDETGPHNIRDLQNENPKFSRQNRPNLYFPIYIDINAKDDLRDFYLVHLDRKKISDIEVLPKKNGTDKCWRWGKQKVLENAGTYTPSGEIVGYKKQTGEWCIGVKTRKNTIKAKSVWDEPDMQTMRGTSVLNHLGLNSFQFPKSLHLIKKILAIATDKNSLILDSFAGSGTTAHAVLALNREDGGNRRFILVECEDYANKITAERVRRVIKGKSKGKDHSKNQKNGDPLGGSFTFCTLGEEISVENMLREKLPDYDTLARHLAHVSCGLSLEQVNRPADHLFAETEKELLYLIYEQDIKFLTHRDSALSKQVAERIQKRIKKKRKTALVFCSLEVYLTKRLESHGDHLLSTALRHSQNVR